MNMTFDSLTILEILFFASIILAAGIYSLFRKQSNLESYFVGDRSISWPMIGASVFAAEFFFLSLFLPSWDYTSVPRFQLEKTILSIIVLLVSVWVIIPRMSENGRLTTVSYFSDRFGKVFGMVMAVLLLMIYLLFGLNYIFLYFNHIMKTIYGAGVKPFGIILIVLTGIFAIIGGYTTAVRLQGIAVAGMLSSGIFLAAHGIYPINLFSVSTVSLPGLSFTAWIGYGVILIFVYTSNQYLVQHLFAARNTTVMKKGVTFAIVLKVVVIGLSLYAGNAAVSHAEPQSSTGESAAAITIFFGSIVISMLLGLFTSSAALISVNVFHSYVPSATNRTLVLVSRLITTNVVVAAIFIVLSTELYEFSYLRLFQSMIIILAAPIAVLTLAALVFKNRPVRGHVAALCGGVIAGAVLLMLRQSYHRHITGISNLSDYEICAYSSLVCVVIVVSATVWQQQFARVEDYSAEKARV
ncbi:MAG: hypothetical protein WCT99_11800 [Bacteroidota bacterium]